MHIQDAEAVLSIPKPLREFQRLFPNEEGCSTYLYSVRFPNGFSCPYCGWNGDAFRFEGRPDRLRRRSCRRDTRLTAGIIMQNSKVSLCTWFWGAFLVASLTPVCPRSSSRRCSGSNATRRRSACCTSCVRQWCGRNAMPLAASGWLKRVRRTSVVATQGEGRGRHHKTFVAGIVEVRPRKKAPGPDPNLPSGQRPQHRGVIAGRLRLQAIPNRKQEVLESFIFS